MSTPPRSKTTTDRWFSITGYYYVSNECPARRSTGWCIAGIHPRALLSALERREDEVHANGSVLDGGKVEVERTRLFAGNAGFDRPRRVPVNVGEGFEERFGVAGWNPGIVL